MDKPRIILFLTLLAVFSCVKDDMVQQDPLEVSLVKNWLARTMGDDPENMVSRNQIVWDWDNAQRLPNGILRVNSLASVSRTSVFALDVTVADGHYEGVVYIYTALAKGATREIAMDLAGGILYSKKTKGVDGALFGLLATNRMFVEDSGCMDGYCWDNVIGAIVLHEVVVVSFTNPNANTASAMSSINWFSVSRWINNNNPIAPHRYVVPVYPGLGGGWVAPAPTNNVEQISLDPSFKNIPKINCTYEQLTKNETIKDLLKDFFGNDADYDLNFKVVKDLVCDGKDDIKGCTTQNADGSITISIDKDYINDAQTPTLFLAETLLHEAIHANLFVAVKKLNNGTTPPNSDFGILYEEYRQKKHWQHEYMADRYISLITNGLREVHGLLNDQAFINDRNQNFPGWSWNDFYEEIAWQGLYNTTAGQQHINAPEYTNNSNLYVNGTKVGSTKTPNCDE